MNGAKVSPSGSPVVRHETIERVRKLSADGTDSSLPPMQPAHPFFSPSFYDESDVSDGSIVFQRSYENLTSLPHQGSMPPKLPQPPPPARERFPSFDSVGSSGSVQYVQPGSRLPPPPPPAFHSAARPGPTMIGQLPYHERRKLMAERAKQQQQGAPAPTMPHHIPPMHIHPEQGYYGPPQHMPFPPNPYPPVSPSSGQPQYAPYPQPMGMFPPQQQPPYPQQPSRLSPYRPLGKSGERPPSKGPNRPPAPGYASGPLPPRGHVPRQSWNNGGGSLGGGGTRSSSFDSSDEQRAAPRKEAPPPPPPVPPNFHVRSDSLGSVSSLGSLDRLSTNDEEDEAESKKGFFQRLAAGWGPSKESSVQDYHRRNQDFLRRASWEKLKQEKATSPMQAQHRYVLWLPARSYVRSRPAECRWDRLTSRHQRVAVTDGSIRSTMTTGRKTRPVRMVLGTSRGRTGMRETTARVHIQGT